MTTNTTTNQENPSGTTNATPKKHSGTVPPPHVLENPLSEAYHEKVGTIFNLLMKNNKNGDSDANTADLSKTAPKAASTNEKDQEKDQDQEKRKEKKEAKEKK